MNRLRNKWYGYSERYKRDFVTIPTLQPEFIENWKKSLYAIKAVCRKNVFQKYPFLLRSYWEGHIQCKPETKQRQPNQINKVMLCAVDALLCLLNNRPWKLGKRSVCGRAFCRACICIYALPSMHLCVCAFEDDMCEIWTIFQNETTNCLLKSKVNFWSLTLAIQRRCMKFDKGNVWDFKFLFAFASSFYLPISARQFICLFEFMQQYIDQN